MGSAESLDLGVTDLTDSGSVMCLHIRKSNPVEDRAGNHSYDSRGQWKPKRRFSEALGDTATLLKNLPVFSLNDQITSM